MSALFLRALTGDLADLGTRGLTLALMSVTCPTCKATPGRSCTSTGGGNPANVPPHKTREQRIAHWHPAQFHAAADLVRADLARKTARPATYYAACEEAAKPIEDDAQRQATPKSVRLSAAQAAFIETAAEHGEAFVSTAHFSGDAARRATAAALVDKGIIRQIRVTSDDYDRVMVLTGYGWQVYREHRLVVRRLTAEQITQAEQAATS